MTNKLALSISLFAAVGMTACSVDSPTPDDFDYSFQEELPEDFGTELGFAANPYESGVRLLFRDSLDGFGHLDPKVLAVPTALRRIMVERVDSQGFGTWYTVRDEPITVDLLDLADGDVARLATGPLPAGRYETVAMEIIDISVVDVSGEKSHVDLPGTVLTIEGHFTLEADETTELTVQFGGLRKLHLDGDTWSTEPLVSFTVDDHS